MPGPLSNPRRDATAKDNTHRTTVPMVPIKHPRKPEQPSGKTKRDKESGKHTRRLLNRHSDPIRNSGGKQFVKK